MQLRVLSLETVLILVKNLRGGLKVLDRRLRRLKRYWKSLKKYTLLRIIKMLSKMVLMNDITVIIYFNFLFILLNLTF